ncbi:MAG TPA: aldehyde ferredoxin oxidoreductase family protein [Bacillota bacterium]|nr:aldehyde ferredoxin oxidoreductase family protein [Bacillota bacterium]
MFTGGYLGKLLRVDLTREHHTIEPVPEAIFEQYLGGRGVAAHYYREELGPSVDPLSPANKLIFFTGPLTGLSLPATTKFQCATRSPETGIYLCTNSSGELGPYLKRQGYDGLIIEGQAARPLYLAITGGGVEFRDASDLVMLDAPAAIEAVRADGPGPDAAVMAIGPAAYNDVRYACIMVGDRSFGRGGAGRVMAAKGLKAVAVNSRGEIPVADRARLKAILPVAAKNARETKRTHNLFGTNQYTEIMNELGCYSVRNFTTGVFEGAASLSKDYVTRHYKDRSAACFRCPVGCAQVCSVRDGPLAGAVSDPEYETVGTLGGVCGVSDFAAIIAGNQLCDEYGIDTMTVGCVIGYAMECYERGLFTREDTGGLELRFGDAAVMLELIRRIGQGEGFGKVLGKGFRELARAYPATAPYMMHVKGMAFAAYEPRGFYGMALAYGTSSRGACHNVGGWTIRDELLTGEYDRFALEGKGELVKRLQDTRAYIDSLGICTVVRSSMGFTDSPKGDVLLAATGVDFTPRLMTIGQDIIDLERTILVREGITREDDYLPDRIYTEPLPEGPARGRILTREMYDIMLDEYYRLRKWDRRGVPAARTREAAREAAG